MLTMVLNWLRLAGRGVRPMWKTAAGVSWRRPCGEGCYTLEEGTEVPVGEVVAVGRRLAAGSVAAARLSRSLPKTSARQRVTS